MATLITGGTGYIGSYVVSEFLREHDERLALLVRARSLDQARRRLWRSLQLHMDFPTFYEFLHTRIDIYLGDITSSDLGLARQERERLIRSLDSVIHVAASLNRKSARACFKVNLRGTLEVLKVARAAADHHGLRRFSDVSTTAVCGRRDSETVTEDRAIDWDRGDYDPYARTKKFCEHMVRELLPDGAVTVFRPSTVLGDSRFPQTTQFDMVRAFVALAHLPVLPFDADWKADIVPADYVGRAIVTVHQRDEPRYDVYNLSAGTGSLTYGQITDALSREGFSIPHIYLPALREPFTAMVAALSNTPRQWGVASGASLFKVFMPYLVFNTVFDNARISEELGEAPAPFSAYAFGLLKFALDNRFTYPYRPWPQEADGQRLKEADERQEVAPSSP